MNKRTLLKKIDESKANSAWDKGVKIYAHELIEQLPGDYMYVGSPIDKKTILNGARSWTDYSYGGCSLIFDRDIAARLCSPSAFEKSKGGRRNPNQKENWLDVQSRALFQARLLIDEITRRANR